MPSVELHLFRNVADFHAFDAQVDAAFHAALNVLEEAGLKLGDIAHAILLSRLVVRLLDYKAARARALSADMPELDAELEALWPMFRDKVDEELERSRAAWAELQQERAN